jgi:hypothetical protein
VPLLWAISTTPANYLFLSQWFFRASIQSSSKTDQFYFVQEQKNDPSIDFSTIFLFVGILNYLSFWFPRPKVYFFTQWISSLRGKTLLKDFHHEYNLVFAVFTLIQGENSAIQPSAAEATVEILLIMSEAAHSIALAS